LIGWLVSSIYYPKAKPKARTMRSDVALENIEAMRRREGIEDVELRHEIRALTRGSRS